MSRKNIKYTFQIHCQKGCSCPKYDCLGQVKNTTLSSNSGAMPMADGGKSTGIILPIKKSVEKLINTTKAQNTSKGN